MYHCSVVWVILVLYTSFWVICVILVLFASFCVIYVIVVLFESLVCCLRHSSVIHKHLFCFSLLFISIFIYIHGYLCHVRRLQRHNMNRSITAWADIPGLRAKAPKFQQNKICVVSQCYMDTTFWAERQRRAKLPRRNDSAFSRARARESGIRSCAW